MNEQRLPRPLVPRPIPCARAQTPPLGAMAATRANRECQATPGPRRHRPQVPGNSYPDKKSAFLTTKREPRPLLRNCWSRSVTLGFGLGVEGCLLGGERTRPSGTTGWVCVGGLRAVDEHARGLADMEFRDVDPKTGSQPQMQAEPPVVDQDTDLPTLIERGRDIKARSRDLLSRLLDLFRNRAKG